MYVSNKLVIVKEGAELQSPKAEIRDVIYKCKDELVLIVVEFWEIHNRIEVIFNFPCTVDDMTFQQCEDLMFTLPLFSDNFTR